MNSKMPKHLASGLALGFILSLAVSAPFASAEDHHDRRHGDASNSAQQDDGGHRDNGQRGNGGGQRDSGSRDSGQRDSGQRNNTPQPAAAPQADAGRDIQPRSGNRPQFSNHNTPQPQSQPQGQSQGQPQYQQAGDHGRNDNRGGSNNSPSNNAPQYNGTQGHSGWQSGNDHRGDRYDNRNSGWQGDRGNSGRNNDRGDRGDRGGRFDYHNDRHFHDYNGIRFGFYFFPDRGYYRVPAQWYGHRWSTGEYLPDYFYSYRIYDWDYYGLPIPPVGCGYIFVGTDAVLIDLYSGRIIDVIYDVY